jgi:hypothetical protein
MTVGFSGKVITKKDLLHNFGSFHDKLESFENGAVDVQVFGNVAVAYGSISENRLRDGNRQQRRVCLDSSPRESKRQMAGRGLRRRQGGQ